MKSLKVFLFACAIITVAFGYPANDEPILIEKGMEAAAADTEPPADTTSESED